ncbi:MAG TPA: M50 family metallopeptidase [Streptosporangiaceae bacterium]
MNHEAATAAPAVHALAAQVVASQAVPPGWVVGAGGVVALVLVAHSGLWQLAGKVITIAHEGGHALVSLMSGRQLEGIRLHADSSGVTRSRGRRTGPGLVVTAAAGYISPSALGAGAAWLLDAHYLSAMLWLTFVLLAATLLVTRNAFGVLAVLVTGGGVLAVALFASVVVQAGFGYSSAWFLLFGGLRPVLELPRRTLKGRQGVSDADHLFRLTRIPAGLWVGLFHLISLAALAGGGLLLLPFHGHLPHVSVHP